MIKKILLIFVMAIFGLSGIHAQNNTLTFDGADDYVSISNLHLSAYSTITLESWVLLETFNPSAGDANITNIIRGGDERALLRIGDGGISNNIPQFVLDFSGTQTKVTATFGLDANTWYHLAGTYDGSTMKLYINGILDNSVSISGTINTTVNATILGGSPIPDRLLDGFLDESRIWNNARTETEIRQNMYRELPDPSGETNLVAYYKFNEISGTILTDSKGNYNGTLTNMTGNEWQTSPAMFGPKNALELDGTNNYVDCGNISVGGSAGFTYSAWIYSTNPAPGTMWQGIIYHGLAGESQGHLGINPSGYLCGGTGDGSTWQTHETSYAVPEDTWVFVTMTLDRTTDIMSFYANGKLIQSSNHTAVPAATTDPLKIGLGSGGEFFAGTIDEIRLWNTARTATEIRENMMKNLTGNESGLAAYYNFDNSSGTTLPDFSGNGNDGTFNGSNTISAGTVTSYDEYSMTDFTANFSDLFGKILRITTAGKEQNHNVNDYGSQTIWIIGPWSPEISVGDTYEILDGNGEPNLITSDAYNTWLNTSSPSWSTTTNWSLGSKPTTESLGIYGYTGGSAPTFNSGDEAGGANVVVDLSSTWSIGGYFGVSGNLILESDINLNGQTISLGSSATLIEDQGKIGGNSGSITTTRSLSNIDENIAGLGAEITTAEDMGSTTITRTHGAISNPVNIERKYQITPTTSTGLDATLVFHYHDDELNGLTEADLLLYKSSDEIFWQRQGSSSVNTSNNTITLTDIDGFSHWTASDGFYLTGDALDFDGVDQYVEIPDNDAFDFTTDYTLEAWIKYSEWGAGDGIISKYNTGSSNGWKLQLAWAEGALVFDQMNTIAILSTDTWYHVAAVNDGGTRHLYVDGIEYTLYGSTTAPSVNTDYIAIGCDHTEEGDPRYFKGKIEEVRIWDDVRTEIEIRQNMCNTLAGTEDGLVAYYNFNSGLGSNLYNVTEHGLNGTLVNEPSWVSSDAFNMWLGATNNLWDTDSNWSLGYSPNASSQNVGINDVSAAFFPTTTSNVDINNIVVGESTTLTVNSSKHTIHGSVFNIGTTNIEANSEVDITGSLYVLPASTVNVKPQAALTIENKLETKFLLGDGNVNIKSDATGTGSLIVLSADNGKVNAERFLTHDRWHYISEPVNTEGNFSALSMGLTGGAGYDQLYRWEESLVWNTYTGIWVDILNGPNGNNSTMTSEGFVPGKGYAINYIDTDKTLNVSGSLYLTNQTIQLTNTEGSSHQGANLVGNPFSSDIAMNAYADAGNNFLDQNATVLDDSYEAFYVWNESADWSGGNADYVAYNNSPGAFYASPGQAFMVMAESNGVYLNFNTSIRKHGTSSYYKSHPVTIPMFTLIVQNDELYNDTKIVFMEGMTNGLDPSYDAAKMKGNPNIALYTRLIDDIGKDMAIQALDDQNIENYMIPVGIDLSQPETVVFSADLTNMENNKVFLEDRLTHIVTDLHDKNYTAYIENSGTGRFYLYFKETTSIHESENHTAGFSAFSNTNEIRVLNPKNLYGDVFIYNLYGQQILQTRLNGELNQQIGLNVPAGYYLVSIIREKFNVGLKVFMK